MEEVFLSGYCRAIDGSRTVTAEIDDGKWEADCAYPNCPFAGECSIAKRISDLQGAA